MFKKIILIITLLFCVSFAQSSEYIKGLHGLAPVADAFAGTIYSDVVNMKYVDEYVFWVYKGVGTTGTSTLTIEACDDTAATNTTAIAFKYQSNTAADTFSVETAATTAGFTTTAGSNHIYKIYVKKNDIIASGYTFVRLKAVEVANDPVLGGIFITATKLQFDMPVQIRSFLY